MRVLTEGTNCDSREEMVVHSRALACTELKLECRIAGERKIEGASRPPCWLHFMIVSVKPGHK